MLLARIRESRRQGRLVEIGAASAAVKCRQVSNIEVKRACGYLFASLCEVNEFHGDLDREHAISNHFSADGRH